MNRKRFGRLADLRNNVTALLILTTIATFGASIPTARAQNVFTGLVTITSMGCNMVPGTAGTACWVNISGPALGPRVVAGRPFDGTLHRVPTAKLRSRN